MPVTVYKHNATQPACVSLSHGLYVQCMKKLFIYIYIYIYLSFYIYVNLYTYKCSPCWNVTSFSQLDIIIAIEQYTVLYKVYIYIYAYGQC